MLTEAKYRLKCNREKPCQNCTARAEQASCKFRGHKSAADLKSETGQKNGDAIRQRIDHLEHLVSRLIAERQDAQSPSGSNVMDIPETLTPSGKTVMDGVHSVHVGAHDWHLVLEEVHYTDIARILVSNYYLANLSFLFHRSRSSKAL